MKKLVLVFLMVFGMAVNMANAEELNVLQQNAKEAIEEYEAFKAKYPKIYNAIMSYDADSKYYYRDVARYFLTNFTAIKFEELKNGERRSIGGINWRDLVEKYGEEETKKRLLKYGLRWQNHTSGMGMAESLIPYSYHKENGF